MGPYYDPNNKVTDDTRHALNTTQGADRMVAIGLDRAAQFIRRNILIQAGRDPDDPTKEFVAKVEQPKKKIPWWKRLFGWA